MINADTLIVLDAKSIRFILVLTPLTLLMQRGLRVVVHQLPDFDLDDPHSASFK